MKFDIKNKLKGIPLFHPFDDATLQRLSEELTFKHVSDDEVLFRQGEPADVCFLVSFGGMKLSRIDPQGREMIMCFCRPGDFIAAGVMMQPKPLYPLSASAIEDSGLIQIPREFYVRVWQNIPDLARAVNLTVMNRMMDLQQDKTLAQSPVAIRIANFLLRSLDHQTETFGNTISFKLTRKNVAESVATSAETVIRVLSQWTQNGWVSTEGQRISILNRSALENLLVEAQ